MQTANGNTSTQAAPEIADRGAKAGFTIEAPPTVIASFPLTS
jgi:hypothetical protein